MHTKKHGALSWALYSCLRHFVKNTAVGLLDDVVIL